MDEKKAVPGKKKTSARKPEPAATKVKESEAKTTDVTAQDVSDQYDKLIATLGEFEADQRQAGKHYNFFVRHRRQVEFQQINFKKFVGIKIAGRDKYSDR